MKTELTDEMVHDMDETGDFMHSVPAPFPTVASAVGIKHGRPPTIHRPAGLVTAYSRGISIPSREQGQAYVHVTASIRRGGI
jgi:hypothetical protein